MGNVGMSSNSLQAQEQMPMSTLGTQCKTNFLSVLKNVENAENAGNAGNVETPSNSLQAQEQMPMSTLETQCKTNFLSVLTPEIQAKAAEEKKRVLEKAGYYRKKYGDFITDSDVEEIAKIEGSNAVCARCKGTCLKTNRYEQYTKFYALCTEGRLVERAVRPCKYFKWMQQKKRIARNFERCQLPPKYVGKGFNSYKVTEFNKLAVAGAKWAINNPDKGSLLLYGMPGVGKTHLAAIIAQELLKHDKTVIFGDIPSILDAIKATFGNDEKQARLEDLMKSLEEVDMLVLDDIGAENPTEWAAERLYLIINSRYNAGKPIIATSNFSAQELRERLKVRDKSGRIVEDNITGDRIVSRLTEMCKPVKIGGEDHRFTSLKEV